MEYKRKVFVTIEMILRGNYLSIPCLGAATFIYRRYCPHFDPVSVDVFPDLLNFVLKITRKAFKCRSVFITLLH